MILLSILALIACIPTVYYAYDKEITWLIPIALLILGAWAMWWDVSSPVYTVTKNNYFVTTEYNNTTYPKEVIISESIHNSEGRRFGAMTKSAIDTTFEFIKFYEIGDMDNYENITKL